MRMHNEVWGYMEIFPSLLLNVLLVNRSAWNQEELACRPTKIKV